MTSFITLFIAAILSTLVNNDIEKALYLGGIFSLVFIIFFLEVKFDNIHNLIYKGIVIGSIPCIYIAFTAAPNNTLGLILVTTTISFIFCYDKKNFSENNLFYKIFLIILGGLIYTTRSRTALIAYFSLIGILFIKDIMQKKSYKQMIKSFILYSLIIVSIFFLKDNIYTLFFNKRNVTLMDISSGRFDIWVNTIQNDMTIWGYGKDYFVNTYRIGDAHNIFLQVLGEFGIITTVLLILFIITVLKCSIKKNTDYIFIIVPYIIMGTVENIIFLSSRMIIINIIMFSVIGQLIITNRCSRKST